MHLLKEKYNRLSRLHIIYTMEMIVANVKLYIGSCDCLQIIINDIHQRNLR